MATTQDDAIAIFNQLGAHFEIKLALIHFMKMFNNIYSKIQPKSKSRNINLFCTTKLIDDHKPERILTVVLMVRTLK